MGFVVCKRCGREWDTGYIEKELSPRERSRFLTGEGCPKCPTRTIEWERERRLALRSISESLEGVRDSYHALIALYEEGIEDEKALIPDSEEYQKLEEFFLCCQRAEERVKIALGKGFLSPKDADRLNVRIRPLVIQVIARSKQSRSNPDRILELAETKPAILRVIQFFTSPKIYWDSQFFTRRQEPVDWPPLNRRGVEKGV
jgi:hypothetical protein